MLSGCLSLHPEINVTRETHFFDDLRKRIARRLQTDPRADFEAEAVQYFRQIDAGAYGHRSDPDQSAIAPDELAGLARSLGGSVDDYFEAYCMIRARKAGKTRWGEKTPRHVYCVPEILKAYPNAKIIYVIRDPRAVVASYRDWKTQDNVPESRWGEFHRDDARARKSYHLLIITLMWRSAVRTMRSLQQARGDARILTVRYEDVVREPERALERICRFLGADYTDAMLAVPMNNSSYARVDLASGISTAPTERWRTKLTAAEIAAIQSNCRVEMLESGYELMDLGRYPLKRIWLWLTLPGAAVRAFTANSARIVNLNEYIRRRLPWRVDPLGKGPAV